jgi:putative transcriptional regulator
MAGAGMVGGNPGTGSLEGRLLVATPQIVDPFFSRSVVYLLAHSHEGAQGLILNRPTDFDWPPELGLDAPLGSVPAAIYDGGPVMRDSLSYVALRTHDTELEGFSAMPGVAGELGLGFVEVDHWARIDPAALAASRIFIGFSGWESGQLEGELLTDSWIVVDGSPVDMFTSTPRALWSEVLRRQGGSLARLAAIPDDVRMN